MAKKKLIGKKHWFHAALVFFGMALGIVLTFLTFQSVIAKPNQNGFDEFGYNYTARLFTGKADGVDRKLDQSVWGDPKYANDKLVMKWSKAWDDARFHASSWTCDAWEDNEWNGQVPGGSGETWHYKIAWVGPQLATSPCWREGGYPIWGQFEVIMSQGSVANEHFWEAHANRPGYGGF